jgi:hypothetical protein
VSTDREQLADLLAAVDRIADRLSYVGPERALRDAADRARRHLLLVESPDGDCTARIDDASSAAYAAGVARGADARPDRRQGYEPGS